MCINTSVYNHCIRMARGHHYSYFHTFVFKKLFSALLMKSSEIRASNKTEKNTKMSMDNLKNDNMLNAFICMNLKIYLM